MIWATDKRPDRGDNWLADQTAHEWASYRLRLEEAAAEAASRAEAAPTLGGG